jgi:uncharacterized membrane protein YgdD (TMEM256/DUF423 family)
MMARIWIALGSVSGALALIVASQFIHATEGKLSLAAREVFDIASDFHLAHSIMIVGVGILCGLYASRVLLHVAGGAFLVGILLFCGGIYAALGEPGERPYIPAGGLAFMIGWGALAISVFTFGKRDT